jgi:hypothetical protein
MPRLVKAAALFAVVAAAAACTSPVQPEPAGVAVTKDSLAADVDTTAGPVCSGWNVGNGTTCP